MGPRTRLIILNYPHNPTAAGGQVKLQNGDVWTARLSPITDQADVAVGEHVLVTGIDGATAVVVPVERSAEA